MEHYQLTSQELENYILEHSEPEDEILKELNRETHLKALHPRMLSGPLQGATLRMFTRMISPKRILEIGTYTGYSAICMAQGLPPQGHIDTIEKNDELADFIHKYFTKANVTDRITLHTGDALEIIPNLQHKFDLVFIDGDKQEYLEYYKACINILNNGSYILIDNVLWNGKVINPQNTDKETTGVRELNNYIKNDPHIEKILLPLRDGLMIVRKK